MSTVPPISNTDRIVAALPAVLTSSFKVTWPIIADTETLVTNDLVVEVNGVQLLPSAYTFSGNPIPGVGGIFDGGTVTLNSPVSDVRVIIYSKRDPRRTGNFVEGCPSPPRTLDALMNDYAMMLRDLHLGLKRAIKFPISDVPDGVSSEVLDDATTRAGKFFAFDAEGQPSVSIGTGNDAALRFDLAAAAAVTSGDALIAVRRNALGAAPLTLHAWLESRDLHVAEFGAVGDGITNDRASIQAAIDAARRAGGGNVVLGPRTYLIQAVASSDDKANGVVIGYTSQDDAANRVNLIGCGRSSVLKAGSRNMRVLRLSDSRCRIENLLIDGDGLPGVCGLSIVPENTTQTSTLVFQQKNHIRQVEIRDCAEGLEMKCGPDVRGADSGCWLNKFYDLDIFGCTRGIWMRNAPNAGGASNSRNHFYGGRCGQRGSNTGLQIDSGQGNSFFGFEFEGIEDGTSPNATPAAIKIANNDTTSGAANESNRFIGGTIEACSADIVNANNTTELFGLYFTFSKCTFTARPVTIVGGYDTSGVPQVMGRGDVDLGLLVQANGQFGTLGSGTVHGGVVSRYGGMVQRRQATGAAAGVAPNIDHGGFTASTPPGGGAVTQNFTYAFTANRSALWLATASGVSGRDNTRNATRASLFVEHSNGGFNEFNLVDSKNTIANSAIGLSRSGGTVTMTVTMSGGLGLDVVNVNFNLQRIS